MDANSGEPWSEADIRDLENEIDHDRTVVETASARKRGSLTAMAVLLPPGSGSLGPTRWSTLICRSSPTIGW
jgi:hypothetical protein